MKFIGAALLGLRYPKSLSAKLAPPATMLFLLADLALLARENWENTAGPNKVLGGVPGAA
jgi:hypothetical protein